jgi:hypothetical protein
MIRAAIAILFSALGFLMFPACSSPPGEGGAPPSLMKPFIDRPGGSQIHYRDADTAHVITLREDGTYRYESMGMHDGMHVTREGGWGWGKLGSHHAELVLDEDKWRLTFVSPDSAMAFNETAGLTFAFQFTR